MLKKVVLVLALALAGCAYGVVEPDLVVQASDERLFAAVSAAALEWNACDAPKRVRVDTVYDLGMVPVMYADARDPDLEGRYAVTVFENEHPLYIKIRKDHPLFESGVAHEIGHALMGPDHFGKGLMADKDRELHVTPEDCRRLRGEVSERDGAS